MNLLQIELPANREPWLISLGERVKMVAKAYAQGRKVNLLLYDHADTSTFRYRCYNLMQWTQQSEKWQCVYFYRDELDTVCQLLGKIQLLTFVRLQWFCELENLVYQARARSIPIVYDTDDCIFDLNLLPLLANSIDIQFSIPGQYEYWFAYVARNGFTAKRAQMYSASNDYLGKKLEKKFAKPYYVVRNTLNQEQLDVSRLCRIQKRLLNQMQSDKESDERAFTIGYFSGSPSHNNDLAMVAPELALFLDRFRHAKLMVVGFMDFPQVLQPAMARGQIITYPLTDFLTLQTMVASVEVNIVPLLENTFTNCKSELKFFEAGAVRTLTVASPIYTYRNSIQHGVNGYLCEPGQWYDTLTDIYLKREKQQEIIEQAYLDSIERYSGEQVIQEMEDAFEICLRREQQE